MHSRWCLIVVLVVVNAPSLSIARKSDGLSDLFGRSTEDHRKPVFPGLSTSYRSRIPKGRHHNGNSNKDYTRESKLRKTFASKERKPNIILILTDDQDVELRSMDYMPKALRILRDGGATFTNAFVTTPMCCPSRSSILTGMYVHNHHTFTNNENCSSLYWQQTHESRSFATYLNNAGYRTAYFGKYLNEYNGTYIPPGWREWAGLIRNSRFYNYSINRNGIKQKYFDNYYKDYYPDLITNDSISFFKQSKQLFINKPVMMVLSYPSPHGPEDAAPQYQSLFQNETTHRTPSWNVAPNNDKQWILRATGLMQPIHQKFTDALHRKRLQTLQSVDDAVERLYNELKNLGELNNTYIFYSSDHGYHLGQFGLVKGKAMPFEFDVKVPFLVRGPDVPQGVRIPNAVLNLDLAPTFLDIAGISIPEHMDGKSVMKLIIGAKEMISEDKSNFDLRMLKKRTWRDTFLIESSGRQNAGVGDRKRKPMLKPVHFLSTTTPSKTWPTRNSGLLSEKCLSPQFKSPCKPLQKWECILIDNHPRIQRCNYKMKKRRLIKSNCICPENVPNMPILDPHERRRQRAFLRDHISKKDFKPQFIGSRGRRSSEFDVNGVYQLNDILTLKYAHPELEIIDDQNQNFYYRKSTRSVGHHPSTSTKCHLLQNNNVNCSDEVYNNIGAWRENKNYVDSQIKALKERLGELKDIRKHLKQKRPEDSIYNNRGKNPNLPSLPSMDDDYEEEEDEEEEHLVLEEEEGDDDDEELDNLDDDCVCDVKPFGRRGKPRRGNRRDEVREERRRQKEERKRLREEKLRRQDRKNRRIQKYENYTCNIEKMNCFVHDNDHWKTPPLWSDGPFCFCQNSNNNTYWCLRTINATHNFLYCEFITGFLSYYDILKDPYQKENIVLGIPLEILNQLHHQLMALKGCSGAKECTVNSRVKGDLIDQTASQTSHLVNPPRRGRQASSLPGRTRNQDLDYEETVEEDDGDDDSTDNIATMDSRDDEFSSSLSG